MILYYPFNKIYDNKIIYPIPCDTDCHINDDIYESVAWTN